MNAAIGTVKNNAIVATIKPNNLHSQQQNQKQLHFKLIEELPDGSRIYENTHALPQAYTIAINAATFAQDQVQARKLVTSETFNPMTSAIIEEQNPTANPSQSKSAAKISPSALNRPNSNQVEIETVTAEPSYLVLTDSFYPVWKAYLNV